MRQPRYARVLSSIGGVAIFLAALMSGCASRVSPPTPTPTGDQAPVSLRNFQVVTVEGHRAVLLRLSRVPFQVRHSSVNDPPQIIVQVWGPVGDGDLPERSLPQIDPEIGALRVSRHAGDLTVVLDFKGLQPPPYSVHQMADWIMIRLGEAQG